MERIEKRNITVTFKSGEHRATFDGNYITMLVAIPGTNAAFCMTPEEAETVYQLLGAALQECDDV